MSIGRRSFSPARPSYDGAGASRNNGTTLVFVAKLCAGKIRAQGILGKRHRRATLRGRQFGDAAANLGDGIAAELISGLAAIPQLRIVAQQSSFSFRDDNIGIQEIANRLGVGSIIAGQVRTAGNVVRVEAKLIDGSSATTLWSKDYELGTLGILGTQKKITADLVDALTQTLDVQLPAAGGASGATDNDEAYELYLLGQQHYLQRGEGVRKSIELFADAVELDPTFAHAWAALAAAYSSALTWGGAPDNVEDRIREASLRAIELDDTIGVAYMTLGGIDARQGKYAGATPYLLKALAVSPNDPIVLHWSWEGMGDLGRLEDALEFAQRSYEINPVGAAATFALGWANLVVGNLQTAQRFCDRSFEQGLGRQCSVITRLEAKRY